MCHYRGPYLSACPLFLLTAQLPHDDLIRSPERFAEGLYGCALRKCCRGSAVTSPAVSKPTISRHNRLPRGAASFKPLYLERPPEHLDSTTCRQMGASDTALRQQVARLKLNCQG